MKLIKWLSVLLAVAVLSLSLCVIISANNDVAPAYEIARSADSYLSIASNTASCTSGCEGPSTVTKITVEQTLEKHSGWFWIWNNVDGASWTSTKYSSACTVTNTKSGLTSGTYRVKSVFTLTNSSGQTETITVYSSEVTVS